MPRRVRPLTSPRSPNRIPGLVAISLGGVLDRLGWTSSSTGTKPMRPTSKSVRGARELHRAAYNATAKSGVASRIRGAAHFDHDPPEIAEERNRLQGIATGAVAKVAAV
jgi:hypothetical protein